MKGENILYKYLIVGHGEYPSGIESALQLLIGNEVPVTSINLDKVTTHEEMEVRAEAFLKEHEKVVVFADLTGGAPHQKVAAILLGEDMPSDHFIISNASMGIMMDVIMKLQFSQPENYTVALEQIKSSLEQEVNNPSVLSKSMMNEEQTDL